MPHNWSGWPGAVCLRCGVEDELEYAIGNGWFDPYKNTWISEKHKRLAELVNGECFADLPPDILKERIAEIRRLRNELEPATDVATGVVTDEPPAI